MILGTSYTVYRIDSEIFNYKMYFLSRPNVFCYEGGNFGWKWTIMHQVNDAENDFSDAFTVGKYKLKQVADIY